MFDKLPAKILVVESDDQIGINICNTIEKYWFDVKRIKTIELVLKINEANKPNLAIISSPIQDKSAIEMTTLLRALTDLAELPIIFLIEQDESTGKYNAVSDEYVEILHRPFSSNKLLICIRSLLRKSNPVLQEKIIRYNDISMDLLTFHVKRGSKQVHLGPTEFKILQLFVQNPKNIYNRRQIIDYIWGSNKEIADRTIDVHINRIRALLKLNSDRFSIIRTIRSAGYCLD